MLYSSLILFLLSRIFPATVPSNSVLCVVPLVLHLYQVSGGFATVHPNNKLTINAVEAAPLEAFSAEVRAI